MWLAEGYFSFTWNLGTWKSLVASGAKSVGASLGLNGALVLELQIHLQFWGKWTVKVEKQFCTLHLDGVSGG